jgi:hypothetical protein
MRSTPSQSVVALKRIGLRMNQALARNGKTATANLVCGNQHKKGEWFPVRLSCLKFEFAQYRQCSGL